MTSTPLPSVIYFSNEDRTLYSYSINGRLLESINDDSIHIISPILIKDLNFSEILIYEIYLRELPFLNIRKKFLISHGSPVLSILLSQDRKFLLCGDGEIAVLSDPNIFIGHEKPVSSNNGNNVPIISTNGNMNTSIFKEELML